MKMTKELNDTLNKFASQEFPEWEDKEWSVWQKTDDGAAWYTVLDEIGLPSDENIIEGETGEMMYLDRNSACDQWDENTCLVSLDNGLTYRGVCELSDTEVSRVIHDIYCHDSRWFPEIGSLRDSLAGMFEMERDFLQAFMERLCDCYVIG